MNPTFSRRNLVILTISLILALLCVTFIFSNSLKDSAESTEQSSAVYELVNDVTGAIGFKISHALVRNLAHFAEFAALGLLLAFVCALILRVDRAHLLSRVLKKLIPSAILCVIIAIVDELIQFGSAGRAPQVSDALLDIIGALFGISVFFAAFAIYRAKYIKNQNDKTASV